MPVEAHESRVLSFRGEPFDAIAELAQGWDMEYHQLDAGPNPSDLAQLRLPGVAVAWERVARTVQISGRPPPGAVVFALRDRPGDGWFFRGCETAADSLALVRPGDELDARLRGGLLSFAVDTDLLRDRLGRAALQAGLGRDRIALPAGEAEALRRCSRQLLGASCSRSRSSGSVDALEGLSDVLLAQLTALLRCAPTSRRHPRRPGPRPTRVVAAGKADAFIRANLHRRLSVDVLVQDAGVGERALRLGFTERFGHGPKAHINALRLNAIRRALRGDDGTHSVTRIAARFGVRHFGDFAVRYRRLFGELPSETLRRPRPS